MSDVNIARELRKLAPGKVKQVVGKIVTFDQSYTIKKKMGIDCITAFGDSITSDGVIHPTIMSGTREGDAIKYDAGLINAVLAGKHEEHYASGDVLGAPVVLGRDADGKAEAAYLDDIAWGQYPVCPSEVERNGRTIEGEVYIVPLNDIGEARESGQKAEPAREEQEQPKPKMTPNDWVCVWEGKEWDKEASAITKTPSPSNNPAIETIRRNLPSGVEVTITRRGYSIYVCNPRP